MKWLGPTLLLLLALASGARADSARAVDHAHVARADDDRASGDAPLAASRPRSASQTIRTTIRSDDRSLEPELTLDLSVDLQLTLPGSPSEVGTFDAQFDLDRPFAFLLPELPPESLRLQVPVGRFAVAYVWADLSDGLPRLDAVDADTYFTPGLEVPLGFLRGVPFGVDHLRVFVEDFQPASGVIGGTDPDEPPPARSWDGHQVAVGLRWEPLEGVVVEGATVAYVLSATRRDPGVGGYLSVAIRY